jgi:hypothetical protein
MSQSLKKTFITTVLTAVKKDKQPTHTPGGPGRLRSWSGQVDDDDDDAFYLFFQKQKQSGSN